MDFLQFWKNALCDAFWSTWGIVGAVDLMISILGLAAYDLAKRRGPLWLQSVLNHKLLGDKWRLLSVFLLWFVVITLILAPYWQYQKLAEQPKVTQPIPVDVHETDPEARANITALRSENERLKSGLKSLGPLEQPIASVSAVAQVIVKLDHKLNNHFIDKGAWIALAKGDDALLTMSVADSWGQTKLDGTVTFAALFNTPPGGPLMGKPVRQIGDAEYVQVEFLVDEMPTNAQVIRGQVVFTINGNQRFELSVPEQVSDGKKVFVRDLSSLRDKVSDIMPSPTPNMEASPH